MHSAQACDSTAKGSAQSRGTKPFVVALYAPCIPLPARGRLRADLPDSGLTTEIASTLGRFNGFTVFASNRLIKDE